MTIWEHLNWRVPSGSSCQARLHLLRQVDAIFRMQRKSAKVIDQFMQSTACETIVKVTASAEARQRIQARQLDAHCPPLSHAPGEIHAGRQTVHARCPLDGSRTVSHRHSELGLHSRWGIEEMYKTSKEMVTVEPFHACSERGVKQELYAHFVLMTWTRLFSNYSEQQFQPPSEPPSPRRFQVNFKHATTMFSSHLEAPPLGKA